MSIVLIGTGIAGLVVCGALKVLPVLAEKTGGKRRLNSIVEAYSVLSRALVANGYDKRADELRLTILPDALDVKEQNS